MAANGKGPHNLSEAIRRLEAAAEGNGRSAISEDLETIKNTLRDLKPHLAEAFEETLTSAKEKIKEGKEKATALGHNVDDKVHEHPWWAIGIVGLIAFLLGFLIGKKD